MFSALLSDAIRRLRFFRVRAPQLSAPKIQFGAKRNELQEQS